MNQKCQNILILDADAISNLKEKIIKDYNKYIKRLFRGYVEDYKGILNEINFIYTFPELDNANLIYEYYINHEM